MARPKSKKSTISFGSYNLPDEIEKLLIDILKRKEISAKTIVRKLLKGFVRAGGELPRAGNVKCWED